MRRRRRSFAVRLALTVVLGAITVALRGSNAEWIANHAGGVLYVLAWVFLILLIVPSVRPITVCAGVLLGTCAIEFLQLWHAEPLEVVRATFPGRILLGNTFSWADFPAYVVGATLGLVLQPPEAK